MSVSSLPAPELAIALNLYTFFIASAAMQNANSPYSAEQYCNNIAATL